MAMKIKGILGGIAAAYLVQLAAAEAPSAVNDATLSGDEEVRATQAGVHLAFAARLRKAGITNSWLAVHGDPDFKPDFGRDASALFTALAWNQWKGGAGEEFSDEQRADFFTGAQVLLGPFDGSGAVFAYFNPWWDALLVVRTKTASGADVAPANAKAALAAAEPKAGDALRIDEFEWLSGETFRGETAANPPSVLTVVPEKAPLSVEIWRVQRATLAKFDSVYSPDADTNVRFRANKIGARDLDRKAEFERIQMRAGLRLKLLSMQMKNEEAVGVAARVTSLLRSASVVMFKRHFTDPVHEFFCETFTQLNRRVFRSGFVPYGYVPTSEGALYVFINGDLPRLYATVSIPAGTVSGDNGKPAIFEWYDLDKASDFLSAWEEEQAAAGAAAK